MQTTLITICGRYLVFLTILIVVFYFFAESFAEGDDWKSPKSSKEIVNPLIKFKDNDKMNKMGETLYQSQCSTCHGDTGIGDGEAGRYLKVLPADLTIKEFQSQTDGEIYWKIQTGKSPMPAFDELLSEKKIWVIINYLRTIKRK